MKNLFTLIALFAVMSFAPPIIHAQEVKKDSLTIAKPVFNENQKDLTDSILAIGDVLTDPQSQVVINDVVDKIQNTPTDGGVKSWLGWGFGVLIAIIAAIRHFMRKSKDPETNIKNG